MSQKHTVQFRHRVICKSSWDSFQELKKNVELWLQENKVSHVTSFEGRDGDTSDWDAPHQFVIRFKKKRDMFLFMLTHGTKNFEVL